MFAIVYVRVKVCTVKLTVSMLCSSHNFIKIGIGMYVYLLWRLQSAKAIVAQSSLFGGKTIVNWL